MIKSILAATIVTAGLAGAAFAQTPAQKLVCDESQIVALEKGAVAITDVAKREAAMKSAASMRQMMSAKDMAACELRMGTHVKEYGDSGK